MRVLVVTNSWPSEAHPYRVIVARQVEALRRAGVAVDVLRVDGYRSRLNYFAAAFDVLRLNVGSRRYDVVHAHTGHCGVIACLQVRYPVVISYVGYDLDVPAEDFENTRTRIERRAFRMLGVLVAGTIAKSERGARKLPRAARARNRVVPNGVNHDLFRPYPRSEARARLGWEQNVPTVLFAGDPARYTKGFPLAEQAVTRTRELVPDLDLRIGHPVDPDQMPLWMNAADVLLLTSVAEGSPNVVKEAMACNLPIVSVDVGDVAENVAGARHCRVCSHDPEELSGALAVVLTSGPQRSDGRERSTSLRDDTISGRLLEVYAAARARGPGVLGFMPSPHAPGVAEPLAPSRGVLGECDESRRSSP